MRCADPSTIPLFITNVFEERATELVSLIRTLWRHDFLIDPNYRPSGCVRQSLNDGFGTGIISSTSVVEELCTKQQLYVQHILHDLFSHPSFGRSFFDLSFELEPLILYCWSQTYSSPEQTDASGMLLRVLQVFGSGTRDDPDWEMDGLKMLLTDPGDTRDLMNICLWSLRK